MTFFPLVQPYCLRLVLPAIRILYYSRIFSKKNFSLREALSRILYIHLCANKHEYCELNHFLSIC